MRTPQSLLPRSRPAEVGFVSGRPTAPHAGGSRSGGSASVSPVLRTVGHWDLLQVLHAGPLTTLFAARPAGRNGARADYIVKLVPPELESDVAAIAAIRTEEFATRQARHPHLISVLAAQVEAPPYFVVMPRLPGRTVEQRLLDDGLPALPTTLWWMRQTAQALDAMHRAGWIHGDVKPANLLVSPQHHLTLLDLGFAQSLQPTSEPRHTTLRGTPHYLAPELLTTTWAHHPGSDLYSLGVTWYRLLTGRLPFPGQCVEQVLSRQMQDRPADVRAFMPMLPREVARLVAELLAKQPLRRPNSAAELAERLLRLEVECLAWCDWPTPGALPPESPATCAMPGW